MKRYAVPVGFALFAVWIGVIFVLTAGMRV
jgi:hypothetical protein